MRRLTPLAVALTLTACAAAFPAAPPIGAFHAAPVADVDAWVASLRPVGHTTLRFSWTLNQDEGSGRGSVGIAPKDSLYFDYRAQLGAHPGSAFILGDTAVWAQPQEDVQKLVPSYGLLWGLVGVPRPPAPGWKVEGQRDANRTAWRYSKGTDTTVYVWWVRDGIGALQTTVTMDGKRIGTVVATFDLARHPIKSRLIALAGPARLDLTFDNPSKPLPFDREMWRAPRP